MAYVKYTDGTNSDVEILNENIETVKATTYNYDRYFSGLEISRAYENVPDDEHKYGFLHEQKRYNVYECYNSNTTAAKLYGVKDINEFEKPHVDIVYAWFNADNGKSYFKSGSVIKYIPSGSTVGSSTLNFVKLNPQKHYIKLNTFNLRKKYEPDTINTIANFDTTVTGLNGFEIVKNDYYCANFGFSIVDITNGKTLKNVLPVLKINNPVDDSILYSAFPYTNSYYADWTYYSTSNQTNSAYTYMYTSSSQTERFSFANNFLGGSVGNYALSDTIRYWNDGNFKDIISCMTHRASSAQNVRYETYFTYDEIIKQIAHLGLFVLDTDNTVYCAEVLEDGQTTGVLLSGEDMKKSYIYDKTTQTTVNEYNPEHTDTNDKDDIQSVGYGYFSNTTMGTLYALKNKLDLEKITQWLLTQTEKIDIANNVVSLKEIPFSLATLGITPIDTNLNIGGTPVTYQGSNVVVGEIVAPTIPTLSVVFADFDIPRLSGTFLDYSPYSKYELLVPFAPSPISLPDWCVDKKVKAIFLYDIYTTACQYVIECNGERICSVSGNFGIDRPISARNVALKDSARLSAQIGTASSVLGGVMSGATGNVGGIISGAIGGVSALSQMILSGKQNYMYTVGANGDSSTVGLYHAAHLKITRTLSAEDENFVHIYGKPLCKVRKLSSLSGYTKCDNVNTSGLTCSESEKQMIKNLLESGVHI